MKSSAIFFRNVLFLGVLLIICGCKTGNINAAPDKFEPTSESLKQYKVPQWYADGKFGIYFHWAPFSVPAYQNEWYPRWMYTDTNKRFDIQKHHLKTWGPLDKFGYKDFIPMFKAEKWDPEAWVKLFKEAGATYLVSAAIHHDGFALWDSQYLPFNSVKMGPKRDIVGEFTAAARKAGLKTGVSTHFGRHWCYYTFKPEYDNWDPKYEGLYGHRRAEKDPPRPEDEQQWENVMTELIDNYQPDYIYVDGGIGDGERIFKKPYFRQQFYNVLAHYYNSAARLGKEVVLTYKRKFLETSQAVEDFERSGLDHIRRDSKWQTDDKIAVNGWCYVENTPFWPIDYLIGTLVDTVSKNGNLMLNVGPRPDGTLRQQEIDTLKQIGQWMRVNGEAIYGTVPWKIYGEGKMVKFTVNGSRGKMKMGPTCVRFTAKAGKLYATCFGWPATGEFTIESLGTTRPNALKSIRSISMLGSQEKLTWTQTEQGLKVTFPKKKPCDYAWVLKIEGE